MEYLMAWVNGGLRDGDPVTTETLPSPEQEEAHEEKREEPAGPTDKSTHMKVYPLPNEGSIESHKGDEEANLTVPFPEQPSQDVHPSTVDNSTSSLEGVYYSAYTDGQSYGNHSSDSSQTMDSVVEAYGEWLVCLTADQTQYYYVNTITGISQWQYPWDNPGGESLEQNWALPLSDDGRWVEQTESPPRWQHDLAAQEQSSDQVHAVEEEQLPSSPRLPTVNRPSWEDGDIFEDARVGSLENSFAPQPSAVAQPSTNAVSTSVSQEEEEEEEEEKTKRRHLAIFDRFLANTMKQRALEVQQLKKSGGTFSTSTPQTVKPPNQKVHWPGPLSDDEVDDIMKVCKVVEGK